MPELEASKKNDIRKLKLTKNTAGIGWEISIETEGDYAHTKTLIEEMIDLAAKAVTDAEEGVKDTMVPKRR